MCAVVLALGMTASALAEVTFDWVTVGNVGNAPDPLNSTAIPGIGSVDYEYAIARYEVTNEQYAEFLNAVAKEDPNGLYNALMGTDPRGGITQSGTSGSFTYSLRYAMGNKPVNFVSIFDVMRFVNWLDNGQPTGAQDASTTEDGVYTISDGLSETRAPGATYFLPTENEWYKAAFHQPAADGGDADDYWLYPTATNDVPTAATANFQGDIANPGVNVVNYNLSADWNNVFGGNVTTVGSAGIPSESYYGTADQGGNVLEWVETTINGNRHIVRGSAFNWSDFNLQSTGRLTGDPTWEFDNQGFRVASVPPTCSPTAVNDGDADANGRVDAVDVARLVRCLSGPGADPGLCGCFDLGGDGDVDLQDAAGIITFFETAPVGCLIDGQFYVAGQRDQYPTNCRACDPAISETLWTLLPTGTECGPQTGFQCDVPDACDGANILCNLSPIELCGIGAACTKDQDCMSGSCNGGVCGDGEALIGGACDSDPDCSDGWVCEGGACVGGLSSFCLRNDQCATGLECDSAGSGRCKKPTGGSCNADADCATNATCDLARHVCALNLNEVCTTNEDCGSGLCSCGILQVIVCPPGQTCPPIGCVPNGVCKLPLGSACSHPTECQVQYRDGEQISGGLCLNGVCAPGLLFVGVVCETNPRGGGARCIGGANDNQNCSSQADCPDGTCTAGIAPQIGESPNDELCATQTCFKGAGGEFGPCTPASLCDENTTGGLAGAPCSRDSDCPGGTCLDKCGNFTNPPDYKCCRREGGFCRTDLDCCGGFLQRARGCKSDSRCGVLSVTGEPCTTTADCIRRGELECIEGFCGGPPTPRELARGEECVENPDTDCTDGSCDGVCGPGLFCLNCEPEGRGFRCADQRSPCCNSGGVDEFFCGETVYDEGGFSYTNQCCNYTCVAPDDAQHCGHCDVDCTQPIVTPCLTRAPTTCEWQPRRVVNGTLVAPEGFRCLDVGAWHDNGLCPDPNPDDYTYYRCEARTPTELDPSDYTCIQYDDPPPADEIPLGSFCFDYQNVDGMECTATSQCTVCGTNGCVCGDASGGYNVIFDLTPGRVCSCP